MTSTTQDQKPSTESENAAPLLKVENLQMHFHARSRTVKAVDDISFELGRGQTLGVVGESGSGKSMTAMSILQLIPMPPGKFEGGAIHFDGENLLKFSKNQIRDIRGKDISMIFQEPMTSLNPVYTAGNQVAEAILTHEDVSKEEAKKRVLKLFDEVGIPEPQRRYDSFPHEMSGGQKQRVMIAMALASNPQLLISDEPTTALDVTIQKQILELLIQIRDTRQMSILFISHDLGVIAEISDYVAVMFRGKLVEFGGVHDIMTNPQHPYTKGLLACRPPLEIRIDRLKTVADFLKGDEELDENGVAKSSHRYTEAEVSERRQKLHSEKPLLEVRDLNVHFPIRSGFFGKVKDYVRAVDGISFDVHPGQTLGLVGESGCGKTTTGRAIIRLVNPTSGSVQFEGTDFLALRGNGLRQARKRIQMIFQDPYSSLNPRMTIKAIVSEGMIIHKIHKTKKEREDAVAWLLEQCGMTPDAMNRFPHEFSGGQRQRIAIARTLAVKPQLIICDESVSALDVSVQAQILNLLKDLQDEFNLSYIFISHDLSVIKHISDDIIVMNQGKLVEAAPSEELYRNPIEDYTKKLIDSIPKISADEIKARQVARGLM